MKLKGILDFSLGNFLCLRGFAPFGLLQDISAPPDEIQRKPKPDRLKEIGDYLRKGHLVFFPEVILCASLHDGEVTSDIAAAFFAKVKAGEPFRSGQFTDGVTIITDGRRPDKLQATIDSIWRQWGEGGVEIVDLELVVAGDVERAKEAGHRILRRRLPALAGRGMRQ